MRRLGNILLFSTDARRVEALCDLKIFKAVALPATGKAVTPGTVVPRFPDELRVATGNGLLSVLEIQGESGNRLTVGEFLRGHPIPAGTMFD